MTPSRVRRTGLSLLEVLISLAVLLIAFGAINYLMTLSTDRALLVHQKSQAARLCQSLLNEVAAGIVPIQTSVEGAEVADDPDYTYRMTSTTSIVDSLYNVSVTVTRDNGPLGRVEYTLAMMLIDPKKLGSNQDQAAIQGLAETPSAGSSSSSGTESTTPSTSGSTTPASGSTGSTSGSSTTKGSN